MSCFTFAEKNAFKDVITRIARIKKMFWYSCTDVMYFLNGKDYCVGFWCENKK